MVSILFYRNFKKYATKNVNFNFFLEFLDISQGPMN